MKSFDYTIKQYLESYGSIYLDYQGFETEKPCPMTLKQANYLSTRFGGYVVELER